MNLIIAHLRTLYYSLNSDKTRDSVFSGTLDAREISHDQELYPGRVFEH